MTRPKVASLSEVTRGLRASVCSRTSIPVLAKAKRPALLEIVTPSSMLIPQCAHDKLLRATRQIRLRRSHRGTSASCANLDDTTIRRAKNSISYLQTIWHSLGLCIRQRRDKYLRELSLRNLASCANILLKGHFITFPKNHC